MSFNPLKFKFPAFFPFLMLPLSLSEFLLPLSALSLSQLQLNILFYYYFIVFFLNLLFSVPLIQYALFGGITLF